jgi:hypothetical protein
MLMNDSGRDSGKPLRLSGGLRGSWRSWRCGLDHNTAGLTSVGKISFTRPVRAFSRNKDLPGPYFLPTYPGVVYTDCTVRYTMPWHWLR